MRHIPHSGGTSRVICPLTRRRGPFSWWHEIVNDRIGGRAIGGPLSGKRLTQAPAHNAFWYAWVTFRPETDVYLPQRHADLAARRSGTETMARVEIYSGPWCPYCWAVRRLLRRKGIEYRRIPIRMYFGIKLPTRAYRDMVARTGGDTTGPQIFVDGRYLGTHDTLWDLEREGRLEEALQGPAGEGSASVS